MTLLPGGPWSTFVRAAGVFGATVLVTGGTQTFTASGTYPVPGNAAYARVQGWGPGGNGGAALSGSHSGGGGGGGGYGEEPQLLAAGDTLTVTITAGSATTVTGGPVTVTANPGAPASGTAAGAGAAASGNTIAFAGGQGGAGSAGTNRGGGGGGSSAGPLAPGTAGGSGGIGVGGGGSGATAPAGGGNGGSGGGSGSGGTAGQPPGGGGGGGGDGASHAGGAAGTGQAVITWYYFAGGGFPVSARAGSGVMPAARSQGSMGAPVYSVTPGMVAPFTPPRKAAKGRSGARTGRAQSGAGAPVVHVTPGPPAVFIPPSSAPKVRRGARTGQGKGAKGTAVAIVPVTVVNQWAATFSQPAGFGTTPPQLQSVNVPLTPAFSVGSGTGVSSPGNWLFVIAGMNEQAATSGFTVGDADDIHSYWRPGAVSTATGLTRTSVWYTANIARQVNTVYVAPNGAFDALAATVFEVAGLGPWDVVTGVNTNYAAAVSSLNLTLGAPSGAAFLVAAVTGDNTTSGQALAPAGWSTLATVTTTNGSDHTCDAVLTSAILTTSGSVSVNATASGSAEDMSGVIIGVLKNAPSPVPAGANPAWPGRVILEAAFGSGYETPPDQMTWTALNDNAWTSMSQGYKRFWSWQDSGGVPYGLGQLQSGTGTVQLDNADGALSPGNSAGPYYPNVTTGTPVRLRCALGSFTSREGTVTANRWYVISRNALAWPEKRNKALRNFAALTTSDVWSVVSGSCPSPYRGEIHQDNPGWWWPMDDQPLSGGVQPSSLRNAAAGSTTVMSIIPAPGGVSSTDPYSTTGADLFSSGSNIKPPPNAVATGAVGQQQGWMYGDPQSSPASYATSNPVTANPGSAAWQQTGMQGNSGAQGWFLTATDTFPALSGGVTVKGWFNCGFAGSATGYTAPSNSRYQVAGQPYSVITLCTLSTATAPVCELQLDQSGHLNLVTFSGTSGTSNTIYSASDLRAPSWHSVDIQLTTTTFRVLVDGGVTASVSGSAAGMTSAWTWLTLNGDYGNSAGGSSPASLQHGGNVAYSHWAVFPGILPAWRLTAHYAAAVTGFGVLPAPQSLALTVVANEFAGQGYTPDGSAFQGNYGFLGIFGATHTGSYTFSALAVAQAGPYTSGPSARAIQAGYGTDSGGTSFGDAVYASFTALAPSVGLYTAASAVTETNAATVCGNSDTWTGGYGSGASGTGVCQVAGGTGASPPSAPSSLGDTVAQRIERVLGYGLVTAPVRAIDSSASLLVQAALDTAGQQAGASIQNQADSDNGWLYIGNEGVLHYRSRPHLTADQAAGPVWQIGMNTLAGMIPFDDSIEWSSDPQKIWDLITLTPYAPDGATLPLVVPSNATAVNAAQNQFGPRPKNVTSYLQDPAKIQAAANWWFSAFGSLQRRASVIAVDAATHPTAWPMVLGVNPTDLVQINDTPMGQPSTTGTYRVSSLSRSIAYGANGSQIEGKLILVCDPLPPGGYWS